MLHVCISYDKARRNGKKRDIYTCKVGNKEEKECGKEAAIITCTVILQALWVVYMYILLLVSSGKFTCSYSQFPRFEILPFQNLSTSPVTQLDQLTSQLLILLAGITSNTAFNRVYIYTLEFKVVSTRKYIHTRVQRLFLAYLWLWHHPSSWHCTEQLVEHSSTNSTNDTGVTK